MNYRAILLAAAERARVERELAADIRHDPMVWWHNRRHLAVYADRLVKHMKGKSFPDPRARS